MTSVSIRPAGPADKAVIAGLLPTYLAELAAYGEVDADYPYFDAYWQEPDARFPYLIGIGAAIAGFALVNRWSPSGRGTDFAMAEFYIAPHARGGRVGHRAFAALVSAHPGQWELGIQPANARAMAFWPRAIADARVAEVEHFGSGKYRIYRFRSR